MNRLLFFFLLCSFSVFSQDFSDLQRKVSTYPKLITVEKLAATISKDFDSKENQVKAAFYWLTQNIRYDLEAFYNPKNKRVSFRYRNEAERIQKIKEIKDNIVNETLQKRKGVCEGYAQTLSKICTLLNIENEVIKGYVRNTSREINRPRNNTNHAWNAIKIDNKWIYVDATWAAGAISNGKWQRLFNPYYYNIPESNYFKTHLPEKSLWRLRVGNIDKEDFYNQPIYSSHFLNSNLELAHPKKGILTLQNNQIKIGLKNLNNNQRVMIGFSGYQFAVKPNIISKGNTTTITATPPKGTKELFVLVDGKVMLEFLIE